jgi:hypothetical protein
MLWDTGESLTCIVGDSARGTVRCSLMTSFTDPWTSSIWVGKTLSKRRQCNSSKHCRWNKDTARGSLCGESLHTWEYVGSWRIDKQSV